ncbi:Hypothetical predicted protein, partial [Paramuricea clavata]
VKKDHDFLQRQVDTLEKEACINSEETQKRLIEDKELQSHIECLHSQLEAKCDALKDIEMKYKAATEENESPIVALSEENEKLRHALQEASQQNKELETQRNELQQQIEELREMARLVDSVATHGEENSNQ